MPQLGSALLTILCVIATSAISAGQAVNALSISGTVVSAKSGIALAKVRVVVADVKNSDNVQSLLTTEDGRFEFHVTPGKYSLQAAKRGYIPSSYNQHDQYSTAIVAAAGVKSEDLVFRLSPVAIVYGKVLDEAGDAVRKASVRLYKEDHRSGVSRIRVFRRMQTDDAGYYEFSSLNDGTYFLSVNATPWYATHRVPIAEEDETGQVDPNLDVAYPITFYAGATESEDATPIPVRGGDRLEVDLHLNPVPALHLIFHVDNPEEGFSQPMLEKPVFDGVELIQSGGVQQVSPGVYETSGVAQGRYLLATPGAGSELKAPEVELTSNDQELDTPPEVQEVTVKAAVKLQGADTLPPKIQIVLMNSSQKLVAWSEVDDKGFGTLKVVPGKYEVFAGSPSKAYSVVRVRSQGADSAGRTLSVPAGFPLDVTLMLVAGAVTVEGFAKHGSEPVAGAMVVLIPKDPDLNKDMFRRDQSDSDGSFSLLSVIPGEYTIVAIEDGWDLDWAKPGVIAAYGRNGKKISVSGQARGALKLEAPVEVQKK